MLNVHERKMEVVRQKRLRKSSLEWTGVTKISGVDHHHMSFGDAGNENDAETDEGKFVVIWISRPTCGT